VPAAAQNEPKMVSVVSRNSVFDGNYQTEGDLRVEGEVRGEIACQGHVLIQDGATVNAKITAISISVAGKLNGQVSSRERFEALPTAIITGEITTPRLVVQEGATLDGQVHMAASETSPTKA
jgi:cytoskeletal protein CcmA (bactofilin family)